REIRSRLHSRIQRSPGIAAWAGPVLRRFQRREASSQGYRTPAAVSETPVPRGSSGAIPGIGEEISWTRAALALIPDPVTPHRAPSLGQMSGITAGRPSASVAMNQVTSILSAIEQGDPRAAEQLLPLVYDELRKLAAQKLAREKPDQTLQATALVHEAYLRLIGSEAPSWNGRGHFFSAAAEAMRRILIENARRRKTEKCGGALHRIDLDGVDVPEAA